MLRLGAYYGRGKEVGDVCHVGWLLVGRSSRTVGLLSICKLFCSVRDDKAATNAAGCLFIFCLLCWKNHPGW